MNRPVILLLITASLTALFYFFVDAPLCQWLMSEGTSIEPWWFFIPVIVLMISSGIAASILLIDSSNHKLICAVIVVLTPFILIWSGIMDLVSMTAQYLYLGKHPLGWMQEEWMQTQLGWFWLEPEYVCKIPFLPYIISTIKHHQIITTNDMITSSIIGALIIFFIALWLQRLE